VLRTLRLLILVALAASLAPSAQAADATRVRAPVESLLVDTVTGFARADSPSDPQRFSNGIWESADPGCWFCQVGPGTAAAVLARSGIGDVHWFRSLAISTFDRALRDHHLANGSYRSKVVDTDTMFFTLELGNAYLELDNSLGSARRKRWRNAITGAADYLIRNGNLTWYTNGNINLGNTAVFYLAWRVSGRPSYLDAYNRSWTFTLDPPQQRWAGFGLHLTRVPTRADGADGAGYLAESGGGTPGFDPEYSMLQLDVASRLYVESGDPRALRLINLLVNQLLPRVDSSWALDTSDGTRRPQAGRKVPFITSALTVLADLGGRSALAPQAHSQFSRINREFRGALTYSGRNMYRGLGNEAAVVLEAASPQQVALLRPSRSLAAAFRHSTSGQ
jgi:hypothetical protein